MSNPVMFETLSIRIYVDAQLPHNTHQPIHNPTMPETENLENKPIILPYQQPVYDRLCAIARSCIYVNRSAIGQGYGRGRLKIRACFLILGFSGGGKTFLAHSLAAELGVPFLTVAVSDWILLGTSNRGGSATWPAIINFIERAKHKEGAIIFIDELDKCSHDSNWNAFLRSEIFSLCDGRVPMNILDLEGDRIPESRIEVVRDFLQYKTMILGGAAFQSLLDDRSRRTMGFVPTDSPTDLPELPDLAKILPVELVNRFSSETFILPELTGNDYRLMVESIACQVPEMWRGRFLELGLARIDEAVRHKKGARYMEEILLAAIVAERGELTNFVPKPAFSEGIEVDNGDGPELEVF